MYIYIGDTRFKVGFAPLPIHDASKWSPIQY